MPLFGGIGHTPGGEERNKIYLHKDEISDIVNKVGKIPVYHEHDYTKKPIGTVNKVTLDKNNNLFFTFDIDESTDFGRQIAKDIHKGKDRHLSLGMITRVDKNTGNIVSREIKELSVVNDPGLPERFRDMTTTTQELFDYIRYKSPIIDPNGAPQQTLNTGSVPPANQPAPAVGKGSQENSVNETDLGNIFKDTLEQSQKLQEAFKELETNDIEKIKALCRDMLHQKSQEMTPKFKKIVDWVSSLYKEKGKVPDGNVIKLFDDLQQSPVAASPYLDILSQAKKKADTQDGSLQKAQETINDLQKKLESYTSMELPHAKKTKSDEAFKSQWVEKKQEPLNPIWETNPMTLLSMNKSLHYVPAAAVPKLHSPREAAMFKMVGRTKN